VDLVIESCEGKKVETWLEMGLKEGELGGEGKVGCLEQEIRIEE